MSKKIDDLVAAIASSLGEASNVLASNGYNQIAQGLSSLKDSIGLLAGTINPDTANVEPGFEDENAQRRAEVNKIIEILAATPIAVVAATAAGAAVGAVVVGGVTALPAFAIGLIGGLSVLAADAAASFLIGQLSSVGITLTGQAVDYSNSDKALTIVGTTSQDKIITTNYDDTVDGWLLGDEIANSGGSDIIDGGQGDDTAKYYLRSQISIAFLGNQEIAVSHQGENAGNDTLISIENVIGTKYTDYVSFDGVDIGVDVDLAGGDDSIAIAQHATGSLGLGVSVEGGFGEDTLTFFDPSSGPAWVDLSTGRAGFGTHSVGGGSSFYQLSGIENVYGTDGRNTLIGNEVKNIIDGLDDNDIIKGGGGDDELFGGIGDDKLYGEAGNDIVSGGADDDTIYASTGEDYYYGGDSTNFQNDDGEDTADFSAADQALLVTHEVDAAKGVNKAVVSSQSGNDYKSHLYSIEKVILSAFDDRVKIDDLDALFQKFGQEIDGGENSADGEGDIVDFSGLGEGVKLKRAPVNGAVIEDSNVTIKNFEKISLSNFDDNIDINVTETIVVEAGDGNDVVSIAGAASEIYLGSGSDILLHAALGSKIDLGTGGQADNDIVVYSPGTLAIGADGYDELLIMGVARAPGTVIRNAASESAYAYGLGGLVKVGFNGNGEMVFGTILSQHGVAEDFMYFANGNNDPFASSSDLTFGIRVGEIDVSAYQVRKLPDGISVKDNNGIWEFVSVILKEFRSGEYVAGTDPLVFDLDGDGLELTAVATGVGPQFDVDGDGFSEYTGWVDRDDGLLAIDLNGNGTIDDISELFGNATTSGFAELALYDTNSDGVIDANDTQFGDLLMWRDLDRDGETDSGELSTLSDLGIASIDLTATDDGTRIAQNTVARTGTFTYSDGTTGTVGDIEFRVNNFDSTYLGDTSVDLTIAATMPNLRGHGTLTDLHVALTLEGANGQLAQTIQTVLPTLNVIDLDEIRERAFDILEAWTKAPPAPVTPLSNPDVPVLVTRVAGSTTVTDFAVQVTEDVLDDQGNTVSMTFWKRASGASVRDAGGVVIDYPTYDQVIAQLADTPDTAWEVLTGAELTYMERFFGESIPVENPNSINASAVGALAGLLETAVRVMDQQALRLAIQGPLKPYFPGVEFDIDNETFVATSNRELIPMFEAIFTAAPADASGASDWLNSWTPIINAMLADYDRPGAGLVSNPFLFTNIVAAYENIGLPVTLKQAAMDLGIPESIMDFGSGARTGTDEGEMFYLTSGNDTVTSGKGADVFVFGRDFGQDVINDYEEGSDDFDVIRFAHLKSDEVTATREGLDLVLTVNATGDTIRVIEQFHEIIPGSGGSGNLLPSRGVEEIVFADGVVWALSDIALAVSHAKDTDDVLTGTDHIDYLDGGLGNDVLKGGDNTDFYVFGTGYGHDRIEEQHDDNFANTFDAVILGAGIKREDLTFTRTGDSNDLIMTINGTTDQLDIINQFKATYLSLSSNSKTWFNRIEAFVFEDGTSISWDDIAGQLMIDAGTDGDDTIYGFSRQDTLDGGAGNDLLIGGNENDTYIFGQGYGYDRVHDQLDIIVSGDTDTVRIKPDLLLDDATFSRDADSDNVVIEFVSGEKLEVVGQFDATYTGPFGTRWFNRIEYFEFYDAAGQQVTINDVQLMDRLLDQYQTGGNDSVYGFYRSDTLQGGTGDDFLSGLLGGDTYVYNIGDGHDSIQDNADSIFGDDGDLVSFGAGIAVTDVTVRRNANENDLVLDIGAHGGSITLINQVWYSSINYSPDLIEEVHFADGTIWNEQDLHRLYLEAAKTDGNDEITGFFSANTLDGGAGNDILRGGDGNDTYIFGRGYGNDTIYEDVRIVVYDDDDKVIFQGLNLDDLTIGRGTASDDIVFTINDTGETLTIVDQGRDASGSTWWDIETFEFADGTAKTAQEIFALLLNSEKTDGNDTIKGFSYSETLEGGLGDDYLEGRRGNDTYIYNLGDGADTIDETHPGGSLDKIVLGGGILPEEVTVTRSANGGDDVTLTFVDGGSILLIRQLWNAADAGIEEIAFADGTIWTKATLKSKILANSQTNGNDAIYGYNDENDTLQGGTGDDDLQGLKGDDTYIYNPGDGSDTITELFLGGYDTLQLGAGITPADVTVSRSPAPSNDVKLHFSDGGSVLLKDQFSTSSDVGVERILFADGTVWFNAHLEALLGRPVSTPGDDEIFGSSLLDDTLSGGLGNDVLDGLGGNDTYQYDLGDGADIVTEAASAGSADKLLLGSGILPADVTVSRSTVNSNAVSLQFPDGGSVTLTDQLGTSSEIGVEQIEFADGTIWSNQDLLERLISATYTTGNDVINGSDSVHDVIKGGLGDDDLNGSDGNDIYLYSLGDGADTIYERNSKGSLDQLVLGAGILTGDVTLARSSSDLDDVTLSFSDGGSVFLDEQFNTPVEAGVEEIVFADGTVWTQEDLKAMLIASSQTSGADIIRGFDGRDDTLQGGLGNDDLSGLKGDDTYIYNLGDGSDTISEGFINGNADKLQLGAGILPGDVTVTRSTTKPDDVTLTLSDGGTVLLENQVRQGAGYGVEEITFDDGTIWTKATIHSMLIAASQTDGNDTVLGFNGEDDTLQGGLGDDDLNGLKGNDTYIYNLGDGSDTITEAFLGGTLDKLQLGTGIAPASVTVAKSSLDADDAVLTFSDGGTITLVKQLNTGAHYGVEEIIFSDGTVWAKADLIATIAAQSGGSTGNVILDGTASAETINGTSGDDVIRGQEGDDTLNGKQGNDTYLYSSGDGNDFLDDQDPSTTSVDILKLTDLNIADVTLSREGNDLIVTTNANGQRIQVDDQLYSANHFYGLEQIQFADGTIWDRDKIKLEAWYRGTDQADTINASSTDDTLDGGLGDDTLNGKQGNDTYVYSSGDGNDFLDDQDISTTSVDILKLTDLNIADVTLSREGNDLIVATNANGQRIQVDDQFYSANYFYGLEQIQFADGTIWDRDKIKLEAWYRGTDQGETINASTTDDTIDGGLGDDTLNGKAGNDTYIYRSGDGNDFLDDQDTSTTSVDILKLIDLDAADVTFTKQDRDLIVTTDTNGQTIQLDDQFYSTNYYYGVEQVVFAGGSTIDRDGIRQKVVDDQQTSGDDQITGFSNQDDTFIFKGSDFGHDTVTDFEAGTSGGDVIEFNTAVFGAYADLLAAAADNGTDTTITIDADSSVLLKNVVIADLHQDDFRFV